MKEFFQQRPHAENISRVLIIEVGSGVKGAFKGQGGGWCDRVGVALSHTTLLITVRGQRCREMTGYFSL